MKKVVLLLLAVLFVFSGCGYNEMQANEETVKAAWGDVESSYQRRMDLIPNLVKTVKSYANFEKETLTAVVEARSKASSVQLTPELLADKNAMAKFQGAQDQLSGALSRLMVVVEKYPDLKANQSYMDLQVQLEGSENRINVARTRYNDAVRIYNTSLRVFPNVLTNKFFLDLKPREPFKAAEGAEKAPEVNFE